MGCGASAQNKYAALIQLEEDPDPEERIRARFAPEKELVQEADGIRVSPLAETMEVRPTDDDSNIQPSVRDSDLMQPHYAKVDPIIVGEARSLGALKSSGRRWGQNKKVSDAPARGHSRIRSVDDALANSSFHVPDPCQELRDLVDFSTTIPSPPLKGSNAKKTQPQDEWGAGTGLDEPNPPPPHRQLPVEHREVSPTRQPQASPTRQPQARASPVRQAAANLTQHYETETASGRNNLAEEQFAPQEFRKPRQKATPAPAPISDPTPTQVVSENPELVAARAQLAGLEAARARVAELEGMEQQRHAQQQEMAAQAPARSPQRNQPNSQKHEEKTEAMRYHEDQLREKQKMHQDRVFADREAAEREARQLAAQRVRQQGQNPFVGVPLPPPPSNKREFLMQAHAQARSVQESDPHRDAELLAQFRSVGAVADPTRTASKESADNHFRLPATGVPPPPPVPKPSPKKTSPKKTSPKEAAATTKRGSTVSFDPAPPVQLLEQNAASVQPTRKVAVELPKWAGQQGVQDAKHQNHQMHDRQPSTRSPAPEWASEPRVPALLAAEKMTHDVRSPPKSKETMPHLEMELPKRSLQLQDPVAFPALPDLNKSLEFSIGSLKDGNGPTAPTGFPMVPYMDDKPGKNDLPSPDKRAMARRPFVSYRDRTPPTTAGSDDENVAVL